MDTSVAAQLLNWQPRQQAMQAEQQVAQMRAMQMQQMQAQQMAAQRAQAARTPAFGILEQMGQQPQPQVPPPPTMQAPQMQAPPPGSLSPGGGNPQTQGGMPPPPQAGPPPGQPPQGAPQQMPAPFRPLPTQAPGGAPGQVPPPPAQPAAPQQEFTPPTHIDTRKVIEQITKSVPIEQRMDVLDQIMPVIQRAQQDELQFFKAQTAAQTAMIAAYKATMAAQLGQEKIDVANRGEDRKGAQGDRRLDLKEQEMKDRNAIAQAKLKRQAGGGAGQGNISKWETDADGNTIGGWTKTGKHIKLAEPQTAKSDRGGFSEEDVSYWSKVQRLGGDMPPRLATTPGGKKLVSDIMKNTTKSGVTAEEMMSNRAQYMGEKAGQRTLGTRTANIEMAGTEADQLADLAQSASMKTARTGMKSLNSAIQAVEKGSASPELRAFVAANTSFINAYARAINPQGVGTVADKEHAREMLDTAFSKGDYDAVIGQLKQEIEAARKSPGIVKKSMRERFTGQEGPKKITGDADYSALPSGAEFIAPDGTTRRKP